MKLHSALLTAAVAVFAVTGPAQAAEKLKFAHVYETTEPYHAQALWAADEIKKRTDGRYEIEVFPASSLGKETDINQGLSLGTVDIIYTGNLFAGKSYGPLSIAGAPFMFRDLDHWKAYAKSDLFKELAGGYKDATGHQIIATTYYGSRHATSNKPLNTPADMKDLKIRVPNAPLYMMFPKAVGANPTPLAFAEVYLALQQGVVDAQENPLPTIKAKKFYEVQKYINLTGHIRDSLLTIAGGPLWNRLSDADKAIFSAVFTEAAARASGDIENAENNLASWFEAQGVIVNRVDVTPFRNATMKLHNGPDATWSQATYDRLQAIK
ncbi:MAG: sialic acid TRAP transporter substrate-binding protein SiaP [Alphaproteobacteria bacterium]|nr:sialic acid TRAP transporter substrate-binding protein SiaP [Alphaproteobacteria bacterium]